MYYLECPHCNLLMIVEDSDVKCNIFRHGIFKSTLEQINPHASEDECKWYIEQDMIYGCGKPFTIVDGIAIKCCYDMTSN